MGNFASILQRIQSGDPSALGELAAMPLEAIDPPKVDPMVGIMAAAERQSFDDAAAAVGGLEVLQDALDYATSLDDSERRKYQKRLDHPGTAIDAVKELSARYRATQKTPYVKTTFAGYGTAEELREGRELYSAHEHKMRIANSTAEVATEALFRDQREALKGQRP